MARWSEAEDQYILECIQDKDEFDYAALVEDHNKKFNKQRTEDTYKARLKKVAKENNVVLKTNNHWTEDDKTYVENTIQRNPFDIKWDEMASHLNRSEASIKKMYNDLVSAEDHLEWCLLNLDVEDIAGCMEEHKRACIRCKRNMYSNPCVWQGNEYCDECHYSMFNDIIVERWVKVREYSVEKGKSKCNICNKIASFDNTIGSRFHYDHLDMFDKSDSICKMVKNGTEMDDIYKEISKCQLLCLSCHTVITKVELMCGFTRIKRQITKEYNETNDALTKDALTKKYSELYNSFMMKAYNQIRASI
jgi:hypothetical protein